MRRHRNLYDLQRWRGNRLLLLGTGIAFLTVTIVAAAARPGTTIGPLYSLIGSLSLALAAAFWMRQRFSYLAVVGDALLIRTLVVRHRIPLERIRRARVASLGATFSTPERRRLLPVSFRRPRFLGLDAVVLRLDADDPDRQVLRRLLGRRCFVERDMVVPVDDAAGLLREIGAARPAVRVAAEAVGGRRQRRRRR